MDLIEILKSKVKPELNHIYTERPIDILGGEDLGWFCREHALHIYGLAVLLNKPAAICTGDYILRRPGGDSFHSVGAAADHAWCRIDDIAPVDVSFTIKHIYTDLRDASLVYGDHPKLIEPFQLKYGVDLPNDVFFKFTRHAKPLIAYNEKGSVQEDLLGLMNNPFRFLREPPSGFPTFPEIHGSDVFYAITYHCYRLATEDIKPLSRYMSPSDTVKRILKFNPDAKYLMRQMMT